jgi:hypothetical protein
VGGASSADAVALAGEGAAPGWGIISTRLPLGSVRPDHDRQARQLRRRSMKMSVADDGARALPAGSPRRAAQSVPPKAMCDALTAWPGRSVLRLDELHLWEWGDQLLLSPEPGLEAELLRQQLLELAYQKQKLKTEAKDKGWIILTLLALNLLQFFLR